jgi:fumarate reductase subunit C
MGIPDNFIIFRNYGLRGYWEASSAFYTTYIMHDIILNEDKFGITLMLALHGMSPQQLEETTETLINFTRDPQEDMFIVEL